MSVIAAASTWFLGLINQGTIQSNLIDPINTAFDSQPVVYTTSVTITPAGSSAPYASTVSVSLPTGVFSSAPTVSAMMNSVTAGLVGFWLGVTGVTNTGFNVTLTQNNNTPRTITLIVVGLP